MVTVPGGPSIACSTPTAMRWHKEWEGRADPSGRAMAEVHCSTTTEGGKRKASEAGGREEKRAKS